MSGKSIYTWLQEGKLSANGSFWWLISVHREQSPEFFYLYEQLLQCTNSVICQSEDPSSWKGKARCRSCCKAKENVAHTSGELIIANIYI